VYAWWLRKGVLVQDKGTEQMQRVWNGVREGALSYLRRQLKTIIPILFVLAFLLFFTVYITTPERGTEVLFGDSEAGRIMSVLVDHGLRSWCKLLADGWTTWHAYCC